MAIIFTELLARGIRAGKIPAKTSEARSWYRSVARNTSVNEAQLLRSKERGRMVDAPAIGSMFMFKYDAKYASTLPYYDQFPLIFPFNMVSGGFYGINLHYLPPTLRAKLMDALYDTASNKRFDESTKLKISYGILNKASKFSGFRPCVKRYLNSQVKSRMIYIYPSEWDIALFLPTERFTGASKSKVWADSRKLII